MPLKVHIDDVIPHKFSGSVTGETERRKVMGKKLSLGFYKREAYASKPHYHIAEQINYVQSGKVWWFVEGEGFLLGEGDLFRVPAEAVHWAKVEEGPVEMIQAHAPPSGITGATGVYSDDEIGEPEEVSLNKRVELEGWEEQEAEMIEQYYEENPDDR